MNVEGRLELRAITMRSVPFWFAILLLGWASCTRNVGGGFGRVRQDGAQCSKSGECASASCVAGTCAKPPDGIVEIDADCSNGEKCVSDAACQEGICVQVTDPSSASSSSTGASSTSTGSSCKPEGGKCFSTSECCKGGCDQVIGKCSSTCSPQGVGCKSHSECCSDTCTSGKMTCI